MDLFFSIIGWTLGSAYLLWICYLAITNLRRAQKAGKLHPLAHALGMPLVAFGIALDCLVNVTIVTLIAADLPREFFVTTRMKRYQRQGSGWRFDTANWVCRNLLDAFDHDGCHCDPQTVEEAHV